MNRFKVGSMVEVLSKKDSLDLWRCAQIVADDGDGYKVRYFRGPGIAKDSVHKVPTEALRPCQRPATGSKNWVVGDVVEVLDDGFWRVSVIEEVLEDDYYYIRVIGSLDEFKVKNSNIRARKEWRQNKWFEKDPEHPEDLLSRMHKKSYMRSPITCTMVQESPRSDVLSKSLKRPSPDHPSTDEASSKCVQKRRVVAKEMMLDDIHGDAWSFTGKVDHSTKKTIRSNEVNIRNHNDFKLAKSSEADDCVSIVSSVASCSVTTDRLLSHSSAESKQDSSLCSDADSHSNCRGEEEVSDGQVEREDPLKTHELDLHGYRSVLESLYKSGPLTWQQEIALTNLRMKLYVSNDEHLLELRRLKSMGGHGVSCY